MSVEQERDRENQEYYERKEEEEQHESDNRYNYDRGGRRNDLNFD